MDGQIFVLLVQDGISNGAIYLLLAVSLVLVFSVTRVLFLPQGEFVVYGALSYAVMQRGEVPLTAGLLMVLGVAVASTDIVAAESGRRSRVAVRTMLANVVLPAALALIAVWAPGKGLPSAFLGLLAVALIAPLGPMLYRIAFQPVRSASVLTLMIIATALHFALSGLALYFFGPEGLRAPPFSDAVADFGGIPMPMQSLIIVAASAAVILLLWLMFERTLTGKALRASAVNQVGARLLGIRAVQAGKLSFALAAGIGAFSGVLIVPVTTIYYDSGLIIGLKGFIGAVFGALVSFPGAAVGAMLVGLIDSFAAFWASAFKEVILFLMIIPVLVWLSIRSPHAFDEAEEH